MNKTEYVELSDATIAAHAGNVEVLELRDKTCRRLKFRYRNDRRRGTWSVLSAGAWAKAADWPETPSAMARSQLLAGLLLPTRASVRQMELVTDVLRMYARNQSDNGNLNAGTRMRTLLIIRKHLMPLLESVRVCALSRRTLHAKLIQPLQRGDESKPKKPAYIRKIFVVLKAAFRMATCVGYLAVNPLADIRYVDFGLPSIKPKPAGLRVTQLAEVVEKLVRAAGGRTARGRQAAMLAVLMLATGTRIGEARQARWADFKWSEGVWVLPAGTTKTRMAHEVAITPYLADLLTAYRSTFKRQGVYLFPGAHGRAVSAAVIGERMAALSGRHWSSHDLRKLARSMWALLRIDTGIAEALLNHAPGVLLATYVQADLADLKREALDKWHAHLAVFGLFDRVSQLYKSRVKTGGKRRLD